LAKGFKKNGSGRYTCYYMLNTTVLKLLIFLVPKKKSSLFLKKEKKNSYSKRCQADTKPSRNIQERSSSSKQTDKIDKGDIVLHFKPKDRERDQRRF
jgi:hypothetical protein